MKKSLINFVVVIVVLIVVTVGSQFDLSNINTAGGGGTDLQKANQEMKAQQKDTTKVNFISFGEVNVTNEQELFQVNSIGNLERIYANGFMVGGDFVATVSSEFGVCCPTFDVKGGYNFGNINLEAKVGNFNRNGVTTQGFGPQFANFTIISGEGASVANAIQLSATYNGTKLYAGHQGGSKFYKFNDGNYYVGLQQNLKNLAINGGMDFAEQATTGYAAVKWTVGNDVFTATGNKLGSEKENYVVSYMHNNIPVCKGVVMNVGSALYCQPEKTGLQLVAGLSKGSVKLFAQAGGYVIEKTAKPIIGLGLNYKL